MKFELLADSIKQINDKASSAAKSAVNELMTLLYWSSFFVTLCSINI